MKKKAETATKKAPVAPKKKVFYTVSTKNADSVADEEMYLYDSLEEAYNNHVQNEGYGEKLYAYKVEYMGQASMELTIKP